LGHVTHFEILGLLYILGTVKDRNILFSTNIETKITSHSVTNYPEEGVVRVK